MVKFQIRRTSYIKILRKFSTMIDMVIAGVMVAGLIDSATVGLSLLVGLILMTAFSVCLSVLADILEAHV